MNDGDDFDGLAMDAIDLSIRKLKQFSQFLLRGLGYSAARCGERLGLPKPKENAIDESFCIDGRSNPDRLNDGSQLIRRMLRPPEREGHDARRIRLRMRGPSRLGVGYAARDGLSNVDLISEIIPSSRVR